MYLLLGFLFSLYLFVVCYLEQQLLFNYTLDIGAFRGTYGGTPLPTSSEMSICSCTPTINHALVQQTSHIHRTTFHNNPPHSSNTTVDTQAGG